MREIEFCGTEKNGTDTRSYKYSLFECPVCGSVVKKKTKDGVKAKTCSIECSRPLRGPKENYKPYVMISGYKYIYSPEHPYKSKSGYVAEHRLVAEKILGRCLTSEEEIHHINFDKTDNREENILIMTSSEHQILHSRIKCVAERGKQ